MRRFFCWYNVKRILCWLLVLALVAAGVYLFDIDYKIRPSRDIDIQTLAEDIERNGLLHNLVVSRRRPGEYVILSVIDVKTCS